MAAADAVDRDRLDAWYRVRPRVLRGLVVGSLVLLVLWPPLVAAFTDNSLFYVTLAGSALISIMLVISLNMAMGYGGLLSIVHTGMLAVGGYATGVLTVNLGWSAWVGILVAVLLTALFGTLVTAVSLRATYLYFGMITLSFNLLVVEVAREWEGVTGGFFGLVSIPRPALAGSALSLTQLYYLVLVLAVGAYVFQRNLVTSRSGRAWQAVRESGDAATALGIRVNRAKLGVFTLAGGLAGLAGAMFAHLNRFMNPDVGLLDNALVLFIGLLLGGISTLPGPVLGVALFTVIDQGIKDLAEYRRLILGLILLAAMMVIPRGIVGSWRSSRLGRELEHPAVDEPPADEPGPGDEPLALQAAGTSATADPVVAAECVVKRFGGITALDGVDIEVRAGEIHGIIGPNGSGKSTLVSCLTRYLDQDEGEVRLFGEPAPRHAHQVAEAGVIRVFQVPHLFERVSVLDNVLTGMHMHSDQHWLQAFARSPGFRADDRALRAEARRLLEVAGLGERAERAASSLSHGQKRLLEVVRAVAARPRVLVLDEPATGLTAEEVDAVAALLDRLRSRGLTILLIEHNLAFVMRVCERITVLEQGRVIAVGAPEEIRSSTAVQDAYLGRDAEAPAGADVVVEEA